MRKKTIKMKKGLLLFTMLLLIFNALFSQPLSTTPANTNWRGSQKLYMIDSSGGSGCARESTVDDWIAHYLPTIPTTIPASPLFFSKAATTIALTPVTYLTNTLTAIIDGRLSNIDGIKLDTNDIFLVNNQVAQLQNGLYVVADTGTVSTPYKLVRDTLYDETDEIYPSQVNVLNGIINANKYFLQQTVKPTVGISPIVYKTISVPVIPDYSVGANLISISTEKWRSSTAIWVKQGGGTAAITVVNAAGSLKVPTGKAHQFVGAGNDYRIEQLIPINTDLTYYGRIWAARISGSGTFYAGYIAYDKNLSIITGNGGSYGYFIAAGVSPSATGTWYYNKIQGEGTNILKFPVGTRFIKPLIITNHTTTGTMQVAGFEITDRPFENVDNTFDIAVKDTTRFKIFSNGNIGIGATSIGNSTLLDLTSSIKAFLPTRLTTTQRDNIGYPINGMFLYNSSTNVFNGYQNGAWSTVGGGNTLYIANDALASPRTVTLTATNSLTFAGGTSTFIGSGVTSGTTSLAVQNSTGSSNSLVVLDNAKVGIGTAAPDHGLTISGSTYDTGLRIINTSGSGSAYIRPQLTDDVGLELYSSGSSRLVAFSTQAGYNSSINNGGTMTFGTGGGSYALTVGGTSGYTGLFINNLNGSAGGYFRNQGTDDIDLLGQSSGATRSFEFNTNASVPSHFNVGNFSFGSASDLGARVGIKGSGTTSSTTDFVVHNSTGTNNSFRVLGNGTVIFGASSANASSIVEVTSTTQGFRITPMTATQASAITPSEGLILFVSDTNGTFTSIGLWDYENGAWHKL